MAKEQLSRDIVSEARLPSKTVLPGGEKPSLNINKRRMPMDGLERDVVVSDAEPLPEMVSDVAADPGPVSAEPVAGGQALEAGLERLGQSLSTDSLASLLSEDSLLSKGSQLLAQASTGAISSGASSSAAATTATSAASATAAGATAGAAGAAATVGAVGAVGAGVAVAATVAVAAAAASSKEETKDTTPPTAPTLALTSDTNITSDGISSNGSVTISGLESGATWQYSTDGGSNWTTGSGTSFTLASGTYAASALKVRQTDVAGNVSTVGTNASGITVDTTAPATPTVTLQTSDATTVTFSVTLPSGLQAGDTAQLYLGSSALGSAVSVTSGDVTAGSVSVTLAKTLLGSSGVKSIQAELTDVAGNHSAKSTALSITYQPDNAVSDGYIQGASVYLDINRDGVITTNVDKWVGTTDATGNFSALLTSEQLTYDLLAQGGIDVSTGLDYLGMLKAPAGSTILNPLTTLVQTMAADSLSANATDAQRAQALAEAQATLKQALNLPDTDLTKLDLLKVSVGAANSSTVTASDAVDIQAKAVMVANLIKTGASALEGASGGTTTAADASKFVIQGLVQNLKTAAETGQTVQLSDATSIGTVLTAALNSAAKDATVTLDTTKATDAMNATSVALANVNEFITAAAGSAAGGGSVAQALTQVVQAQVIAQSDVANALKSTTGNLSAVTALGNVADVRAAATGVNTSNLVLAQNVAAQTVTADTTAPTILRVGAKADALTVYTEGQLLVFGVGFSEGVLVTRPADGWLDATGAPNAGTPTYTFTIGGETRTAYYDPSQSSGNVLRLVYKVKGNDAGAIAFTGTSLGGSPVITDLAGNALASTDFSSNALQLPTSWTIQALTFTQPSGGDSTAPTVVITNDAPANSAPATGDVIYTFTFSEKVVGFTPDDVEVTNGVKGKFTTNTEGTIYTLVVKPNTGFAGQMNLQLKAGQLFDQAGNTLAANVNSNVLVDLQPPTVRIETSALELSPTQNTVQVKFVLSDAPAGGTALTTDDFVVTGATLSNFSGGGTTYSATLTLQTGATAVNLGVKPGAFADAQGMLSMGSGFNFTVLQNVNFRTLTQNFVSVGSGQTFAFSNEGTAQNTADDKQGVYTLQAANQVTVAAFVKQGLTSFPSDAQALLDAIASAANASAFATAISLAQAKMDLQFGVRLGDAVDITGDGTAEKGAIATLLYVPPTGANVVFAADNAAALSAALQPVTLSQAFVKIAAGKTLAYSNNGTLANASDDKQGAYTLTGTEVVTVMVAPKPGANLPGNAQSLLNAIKNATSVSEFATAVTAAKALMEVNFGVSLGDSADITGDKVADKGSGAALVYVAPAGGALEVTFTGDAGGVVTAGIQPIVLSQTFLQVGTGKTFAYANNGTPTNTGDDRQGAYTLLGSEKITVMVAPKPNEALPADAAALLSAIKNATTVSAFAAAVAAAKAKMEVNFTVNLGDGVDITGDTVADKGAGASLVYTAPSSSATTLTLTADAAAVTGGGIQPILLTQNFLTLGAGKTFAFSNNGTPTNSGDDKQGAYQLAGTEKVSVVVAPKPGEAMPENAQTLLNAIKNATTVSAFATAVAAAKAVMEVNFGVNLGDGVDITGDGLSDKGSAALLAYVVPAEGATAINFQADSSSLGGGLQPVVLTQAFVKAGTGQTFAFSNNGTPTNSSDDKQGVFTLTGNEKVTVMVAPKPGEAMPESAQTLLNAIKNATTVSAFATAVAAAKAVMEVNFGVNLGDGADITGDGMADKGAGASLVYSAPTSTATLITLAADAGSVTGGGLQPVVLTQAFVKAGTGQTFAYANNGTPTNSSDDKQGVFTLTGNEKVTVMVAPKPGEAMPESAQTLLNAIKNATTVSAFATAVAAAKAVMEVNFGVNLGDGADITGDGMADKGAGAALVYTSPAAGATLITLAADSGSVTGGGLQPVVLTQAFVKAGTGQAFAFSNNGTPTNSSDDKQGVFTLTGNEKVTVMVAPKPGEAMPESAQTLLNAIKNATTVSAFATAVAAAKAVMEVNFGVNLGDGADITGDGLADKGAGASLVYSAPTSTATLITLAADAGSVTGGGLQPVVLTQAFVKAGTGQTFAYANNGTPTNSSDDKQGVFTLTGNEKVTVMVAPKPDEAMPESAQTLLNAIKNATTVSAFATAVAAAKAVMEVNFGVNLGDGADITGDGMADKGAGASLVYSAPTSTATLITLAADAGSVTGGGLQPVILSQEFIKTGAGHAFAASTNGTLNIGTDDKYGAYYLNGSERVAVMASVRTDVGEVTNAQALLNALAGATTAQEFNAAVNNASAKLNLNFGVNLGDSVDITKDGVLDKGSAAGLVLRPIASADTLAVFAPQSSQKLDLSASTFLNLQVSSNAGTLAFASNGTPFVSSDDVLGLYTALSTDKVGITARIKADASTSNINFAQLLGNIKSASSLDAFNAALTAASPYLEVVFGIDVGDKASINGDSVLEKGTLAKLIYTTNGNLSASMEIPLMDLSGKGFLRAGTGSGAAVSLGNFAFTSDDKYGSYVTTAQDTSNLRLSVKILDAIDATEFQAIKGLVNAVKTATNLTDFKSAMTAASANSHIQVSLLNYIGDFKDINADGNADWNAYSIYTMQGGAVSDGAYVLKPYAQSATVLPSWITDSSYGPIQSSQGSVSVGTNPNQLAMTSLLFNDNAAFNNNAAASWLPKVDGVRPAGASLDGSALNLSYAFQAAGAAYQDGQGANHTIQAGFNSAEIAFIRSVFGYFGEVVNIKFTETDSQAQAGVAGAADIRMFKDTAANLVKGDKTTLGFAFQPVNTDPKAVDQDGNFFLISDANELPADGAAFQRAYGDEKNTVVHELGHALGLDHPFAEGANAGFNWFGSTAAGTTLSNHLGQVTGGGHDMAATDYMLESIMTYQNPYQNFGIAVYGSSYTNTPWKLGVYDIAALQHLYGANMSFNAGNNVYSYSSNQLVFDTIWDAGGSADMIRQVGDRSAIIDLRGGDHMSRVGLYGGAEYDFSKAKIEAANQNKTLTTLEVQYDDGEQGMKNTGYLSDMDTATQSWHWIADPTMPADKTALVIMSFADNSKLTLNLGSMAVPDASMAYNLGIAFGVVIEQAAGGGGNDELIGNSVANVLIGNGGNDSLKGGGADQAEDLFVFFKAFNNGNDVVQDFENGFDRIAIETGGDGAIGAAVDFADQAIADRYYAAAQSGSDVMVTLYAGDAGTGNTAIGSVNLKNFSLSNLNYLDFKVI